MAGCGIEELTFRQLTYLLIYIIGHLPSAVLIAILPGRLRLVPAWVFALTSPLQMIYFSVHIIVVRYMLKYLICAL